MVESQLVDFLIKYFNIYGYYIVFTLLFLENLFLLGLVIPGETVLIAAAAFSAQGTLEIAYVITVAVIASITGNTVGYFIGRRGGRPLIEKYGGRFVSTEKIIAAEQYFDDHGTKTVFIGRFAAGIRTFVPLLAGAAKMNFAKFLAYTSAAIILWTVGIGLVGFFFGENWPLIKKLLGQFGFFIFAIVAIILAVYIVRRKRENACNRDSGHTGA